MTSVEFRILRETLGLTGESLAARLGVTDRSIRKWENGASPVPAGVQADLQQIVAEFDGLVSELVARASSVEAPVLVLPPGGWFRMVAGRVAAATGARVKADDTTS